MPVPTHREDCETQIWKTKCPDCGDTVYYFSCTCGSGAFFDLNRPPWNPHEERCIPYLIRYLTEVEGISGARVRKIVEEYSEASGIPIPSEVHRRLIALEGKSRGSLVIEEVPPSDEESIAVGQIISVNTQVNFFKRLNYVDNRMGRALLGKIVEESYIEATVREDPDEVTRHCLQYTFFVPLRSFERSKLGLHSRAFVVMNSYTTPDNQWIWLADGFHKT